MTGADFVLLAALSAAAPNNEVALDAKAAVAVAIKTCSEKFPRTFTNTNPDDWGHLQIGTGWLLIDNKDGLRAFVARNDPMHASCEIPNIEVFAPPKP